MSSSGRESHEKDAPQHGCAPAGGLAPARRAPLAVAVAGAAAGRLTATAIQAQPAARFRTHNDTFAPPSFASVEAWQRRAAYLREHVLASAGLLPMPVRTPLHPVVFGEIRHADYSVSKVYFESLPGFLVTGNLYRPAGTGPFPAILSPHGHWPYGRLENTSIVSAPGRAISLARQGFVVFTYDMVGYADSRQLTHTFGGRREALWGLSLAGLQLWDSIRALDFLESLPDVRRGEIGATGESGGGTQTFLLAAVDDRVRVAAPVNMISLHMQGGCLCENPPGLRLDTTNVEIAATIAPRPLLMVSATGDWTANTLEAEYPAVRSIYTLLGAQERVQAVRIDAPHNYNQPSREAVYAWMARWLQNAPATVRRPESAFSVEPPADLLVFYGRALPAGMLTEAGLTSQWIDAARAQLALTPAPVRARALRHALGYGDMPMSAPSGAPPAASRTVLLASPDPALSTALTRAGFSVFEVRFSPFDEAAAAKIPHFETYNRTHAAERVKDVVDAARAHPGAALVAGGDAAFAGLLAAAVVPVRLSILDVGGASDPGDDALLLQHAYVPGLQRAGGLQTAVDAATGTIVIHNAGPGFALPRCPCRALDPERRRHRRPATRGRPPVGRLQGPCGFKLLPIGSRPAGARPCRPRRSCAPRWSADARRGSSSPRAPRRSSFSPSCRPPMASTGAGSSCSISTSTSAFHRHTLPASVDTCTSISSTRRASCGRTSSTRMSTRRQRAARSERS